MFHLSELTSDRPLEMTSVSKSERRFFTAPQFLNRGKSPLMTLPRAEQALVLVGISTKIPGVLITTKDFQPGYEQCEHFADL